MQQREFSPSSAFAQSQWDSQLKDKFEDRRLNSTLFRRDRAVFISEKSIFNTHPEPAALRFPHPRYFHSGERQVLVRFIMVRSPKIVCTEPLIDPFDAAT